MPPPLISFKNVLTHRCLNISHVSFIYDMTPSMVDIAGLYKS
jgi:hypothetical protein